MQVLVVIVEKDGANYIARCPNLLGVSITAKTYEEAQDAILDAIDDELNNMRRAIGKNKITVGRGKLEEVVYCLYDYRNSTVARSHHKCVAAAKKDSLCWSHWRRVYGHYVTTNMNLDGCPLCGETDQKILRDWSSPCPFKVENENWAEVVEERKLAKQKARMEAKTQKHFLEPEKYLRCLKIKTNGTQCSALATKQDLCERHYNLKWRGKNIV